MSALRRFSCVDVVYIDFSRAFDSIIHSKLFAKMSACGVSVCKHMWIAAFCVIVSSVLELEIVFLLLYVLKVVFPRALF